MKFRTEVNSAGKTATGIQVPDEIVETLGSKRAPVRVTINGHTYRSSLATVDGRTMVGVSAEVRVAAGVAGGDMVDVDIELDTQPREVEVPADLAEALGADAEAKRFFEGLTYSNKRRLVMAIEGIKGAETRARRVAKTVADLHAGKA
jgi:hypothetical protein